MWLAESSHRPSQTWGLFQVRGDYACFAVQVKKLVFNCFHLKEGQGEEEMEKWRKKNSGKGIPFVDGQVYAAGLLACAQVGGDAR